MDRGPRPRRHWIFGSASGYPRHERYGDDPHPYVDGGIERLDRAFDWAERHGLAVLVDLHCAPGCQNAFDNGGIEGVCDWWKRPEYVDFTILTLERLAERYGNGIEAQLRSGRGEAYVDLCYYPDVNRYNRHHL